MKDILIRALKTFWQAALAYLLADVTVLTSLMVDHSAWRSALVTLGIGALAAGLSAAWNGIVNPALQKWASK